MLTRSQLFVPAALCLILLSGLVCAEEQKKINEVKVSEEDAVAAAEADLIRLESRFIGDKEQPSVSYFVPWKGTDSADDLKWKIERKNDDTLNVVDRNIMLRSMNIYNEMGMEQTR